VSAVRRPPPRRRRAQSRLLLLPALAVAFVAGIGLGEALNDGPARGDETIVRTLSPLKISPVPAETVTITTPNR
jgi:hypothetical protein